MKRCGGRKQVDRKGTGRPQGDRSTARVDPTIHGSPKMGDDCYYPWFVVEPDFIENLTFLLVD
ncbi:MAG: hypothetical protein E6I80_18310 [Chloroflexi bacterium]|nr:MAG: hypothetical protein E6I80_18310 [Chloroflexota bacterium]